MVERIVNFHNLLSTGRAVKRRGSWVRLHLAGRVVAPYWVEFTTPADARRVAGTLMRYLVTENGNEKITGNSYYNHIIMSWIARLEEAGYVKQKEQRDEIESSETESQQTETESGKDETETTSPS